MRGAQPGNLLSIPAAPSSWRDFRNYQYDAQYRVDGLNGSGELSLLNQRTGSMVTLAAFLGANGGAATLP